MPTHVRSVMLTNLPIGPSLIIGLIVTRDNCCAREWTDHDRCLTFPQCEIHGGGPHRLRLVTNPEDWTLYQPHL